MSYILDATWMRIIYESNSIDIVNSINSWLNALIDQNIDVNIITSRSSYSRRIHENDKMINPSVVRTY